MTFIKKLGVSPFDVVKISGNHTQTSSDTVVFDTISRTWATFDSSTLAISTDSETYSEAAHAPDSNLYGYARVGESGSNYYTNGQLLPESTTQGAGWHSRGDDISYHFGTSHLSVFLYSAGMTNDPDVSQSHLKLIRL